MKVKVLTETANRTPSGGRVAEESMVYEAVAVSYRGVDVYEGFVGSGDSRRLVVVDAEDCAVVIE